LLHNQELCCGTSLVPETLLMKDDKDIRIGKLKI